MELLSKLGGKVLMFWFCGFRTQLTWSYEFQVEVNTNAVPGWHCYAGVEQQYHPLLHRSVLLEIAYRLH